jgi:hypothetical protein
MKSATAGTLLACACLLAAASKLPAQTAIQPTPFTPYEPYAGEPKRAPIPPIPPAADKTSIFRFDPFQNKLVPVPVADLKPGYLYNHFNATLGRRVWSLAVRGGGFLYAMGPGSTQPGNRLDLRGTLQQRTQLLEAEAPSLADTIRRQGGGAFIRLNATEQWELVPFTTIASVYDLEDGRRWEWHGDRRVAVLHTYGADWQIVEGKFVPASIGAGAWEYCAY